MKAGRLWRIRSRPIPDAKVASRLLSKAVEPFAEGSVINFLPEREQPIRRSIFGMVRVVTSFSLYIRVARSRERYRDDRVAVSENQVLSWSGGRPSLRIAPKTAASLSGKPASVRVNPSSASIRGGV